MYTRPKTIDQALRALVDAYVHTGRIPELHRETAHRDLARLARAAIRRHARQMGRVTADAIAEFGGFPGLLDN